MSELIAGAGERAHEEDDIQRDVVTFLRWALPADAEYCHIPNGGQRHKRAAARLVGLGLRAGMPDLLVVHQGRALFIELKAPGGVLSSVQRQVIRKLKYCGCLVELCRSVPEVERVLVDAGLRLRGRVSA